MNVICVTGLVLRHYNSSFVGHCHQLLRFQMGFLVVFFSLQQVLRLAKELALPLIITFIILY